MIFENFSAVFKSNGFDKLVKISGEYFFQLLGKVALPHSLRRHVIADRYVYDTMVNMGVSLDYSADRVACTVRRFLRLCITPDAVIYLDAPPEVVLQRKDDIPSLEYEKRRRACYLALAGKFGFIWLDATLPLEELKAQLEKKLVLLFEAGKP